MSLFDEIAALEAELKEARTKALREEARKDECLIALAFYGNPTVYHATSFFFDPPTGGYDKDFDKDHGHWFYDRPMPGKLARDVINEKPIDPEERQGILDAWQDYLMEKNQEKS